MDKDCQVVPHCRLCGFNRGSVTTKLTKDTKDWGRLCRSGSALLA